MEQNNTKGAYNGLCNRSACLAPGAKYYNHSTREHYCEDCANLINAANRNDAMRMFGHDLCTLVEEPTTMTQNTSLREKAIFWWNSKNYNTKKRLSEGYIHPTDSAVDPVMFLDDETIKEIYLKEHPTEASCDYDVENDPVILGQFAEAEVSKDETHNLLLADCLSKYIYDKHTQEECAGFIDGFKKAQEKDRELIKELVSSLREVIKIQFYQKNFVGGSMDLKIMNSITKAEQHLNNQ